MDNFDLSQLISFFTQQNIVNFFFKAFSILFSVMYLIFAFVIYKQTQVMIKTISGHNYSLLLFISGLQIIVAIFLLIFAILV